MPLVQHRVMEVGRHKNVTSVNVSSARLMGGDLVIVFPYKTDSMVSWGDVQVEEIKRGLRPAKKTEESKMKAWQAKRSAVIAALSDCGLILMLYYSRDRDEIFARIHVDESHLRQVAEMNQHKLELKEQYLSAFAEYKSDYAGRREMNYTDRRVVSHLYKAHVDQSEEYPRPGAIFRPNDVIQLIDYIIRSGDHHCAGQDIGQLLHEGHILHYFPMHEYRKLKEMDQDWFRTFAWGTNIDLVRNYFGERIALYFLFISHLSKWLILPSILGFILFLVDLIIGSPDNYTAAPLSLLVGVWTMSIIHFWRQKCARYAAKWGTLKMNKQLEPTRPEFMGDSRINPVTSRIDRHYPWSKRIWKVIISWGVLGLTLMVLLFIVLALFALRHFCGAKARLTFQFSNAVIVEILNQGFTALAKWLTKRENHRAYSEHAYHLLAKTVVFKFVNCYISLYYIAFFKAHSHFFGMPMSCVNDDCLNDLGSQLGMFMIVRLTLQNFLELALPYLMQWYRKSSEDITFGTGLFSHSVTMMADMSNAEKQSKKDEYDVYEDMDEILVLYGYTTLFVVACPWVPIIALASVMLEAYLDQKKLVFLFRRPFPTPAGDNEPWDTAFDVFGMIAMLTNTAVIIFSSHDLDHWSHAEKTILFLAIEHILVLYRVMLGTFSPAIPSEVKLLQQQQEVMIHRHLDLGGEEDDHESRAIAMRTTMAPPPTVFDADMDDEMMT